MSDIKLPPLPPLPPETIVDESADGDRLFGQDEDALRTWATAYAEQAVREALAAQATALRNFADRKYCVGIDYAMRNEALGWVEKVRTGRYGEAEFACHQRMNQAFGAHVGIYEALKHVAPPKENNHGDTP